MRVGCGVPADQRRRSLNFINLAAALVYSVTVPYAAIQLTLYYFDLKARAVSEPLPT